MHSTKLEDNNVPYINMKHTISTLILSWRLKVIKNEMYNVQWILLYIVH